MAKEEFQGKLKRDLGPERGFVIIQVVGQGKEENNPGSRSPMRNGTEKVHWEP